MRAFPILGLTIGLWALASWAGAQSEAVDGKVSESQKAASSTPPGWKRLDPEAPVWLDLKNKRVILDGEVCLREGFLEMFACLRGTKEHESLVTVPTKAHVVHAALLAAGAEAGEPVKFRPEYKPPTGTEIEIYIVWRDAEGKDHRVRAQEWIKNTKTGKAMELPFVFAGSGFWTDPESGKQHYEAESGDFICVANFPSAMLDVPGESSQSNEALSFEAFTDNIPPLKTKVRLVLTPKRKRVEDEVSKAATADEKPATSGGAKGD
jgi:hypothetical protein